MRRLQLSKMFNIRSGLHNTIFYINYLYFTGFVKMSIYCSICHEQINFCDEEISVLNCGHLFHQSCLQQWLDIRLTCPKCRTQVVRENIVKKIYPSVDEDADLVYKGSSDEVKSILENYNNQTKSFRKQFIKIVVNLENYILELEEKNSKLEEKVDITSITVRFLQEEEVENNKKIDKLLADNEKLEDNIKVLKQNELVIESLKQDNKQLTNSNSKLEQKLNMAAITVKSLQGEKLEQDEKIKELLTNNEKLKSHLETLKQKELAFESLEAENKQLASNNSKLERNIKTAENTVRSLQEEKLKQDEKITEVLINNEKLKEHIDSLKKRELAFAGLEKENKKLKQKLSSILDSLLTDDCVNNYFTEIKSEFFE